MNTPAESRVLPEQNPALAITRQHLNSAADRLDYLLDEAFIATEDPAALLRLVQAVAGDSLRDLNAALVALEEVNGDAPVR